MLSKRLAILLPDQDADRGGSTRVQRLPRQLREQGPLITEISAGPGFAVVAPIPASRCYEPLTEGHRIWDPFDRGRLKR